MNQYPKNSSNTKPPPTTAKPDTKKELPLKKASGVESKVLSDANKQKQVEPNPPGMGKKKRKPRKKRENVETNKTVEENSGQLGPENTAKAGKSQTNFRKSAVFYNKQGRNLQAATSNVPQNEKLADVKANVKDSSKTQLGALRKSEPGGGDGPKKTTERAPQGTREYEKRSGGMYYHYSDKIAAIFKCTKAECPKQWKSLHGWTNGYTQRCRVCYNAGEIIAYRKQKIITFNPLSTDEASAIELLTPTEETIVTTLAANKIVNNRPFYHGGGSHNKDLCDMCQKLKRSCLNKKKVEIIEYRDASGNTHENVTWINGSV